MPTQRTPKTRATRTRRSGRGSFPPPTSAWACRGCPKWHCSCRDDSTLDPRHPLLQLSSVASQRCADCLMGTAEGMRAYSMDLRERVVAAVDRGMTQEQAAVTFGVSVNTVGRYLTRRRNTGSLAPTAYRHGPRPEKTQRLQAWLPARLQVAADATLTEHAAAFTAEEGLVVSLATMSRAITTLPADDPAEALTPAGRRRRPGRPVKSTV